LEATAQANVDINKVRTEDLSPGGSITTPLHHPGQGTGGGGVWDTRGLQGLTCTRMAMGIGSAPVAGQIYVSFGI